MESITFNCKVITPMFLAGADGRTPELRAPSIKGAMRFWWRAMNGHLVTKKNGKWDYSELKKKEGKIFGDTRQRSSFSLQLKWQNQMEGKLPLPESGINVDEFNNDIFKFMTFGLWDHKSPSKNRAYIGPGSTFVCDIKFQHSKHKDDILKSFYCLVHYGGIGAKARNGFGGITISGSQGLTNYKVDPNGFPNDLREYSCFSKNSRLLELSIIENTALAALAKTQNNYLKMKKSYTDTFKKNLIAAHKPSQLSINRKPKFGFYKVYQYNNGKYRGRVTFLPYELPKQETLHSETLIDFINRTDKEQ